MTICELRNRLNTILDRAPHLAYEKITCLDKSQDFHEVNSVSVQADDTAVWLNIEKEVV